MTIFTYNQKKCIIQDALSKITSLDDKEFNEYIINLTKVEYLHDTKREQTTHTSRETFRKMQETIQTYKITNQSNDIVDVTSEQYKKYREYLLKPETDTKLTVLNIVKFLITIAITAVALFYGLQVLAPLGLFSSFGQFLGFLAISIVVLYKAVDFIINAISSPFENYLVTVALKKFDDAQELAVLENTIKQIMKNIDQYVTQLDTIVNEKQNASPDVIFDSVLDEAVKSKHDNLLSKQEKTMTELNAPNDSQEITESQDGNFNIKDFTYQAIKEHSEKRKGPGLGLQILAQLTAGGCCI
jgi:hypothetical protein